MQKHEVESATLLFGVGLPLAGWLAGTYIGNVPLSPFPQALTAALHATPNNPFIVGGVVAGLALAASAAYLFHEYGDDGLPMSMASRRIFPFYEMSQQCRPAAQPEYGQTMSRIVFVTR